MRRLIAEHDIETVWSVRPAPLAPAGPACPAVAGAGLAIVRGHEIGLVDAFRSLVRCCATSAARHHGVVTFVSSYTRSPGLLPRFGPAASLPPGVDTDRFRPDPAARARGRGNAIG